MHTFVHLSSAEPIERGPAIFLPVLTGSAISCEFSVMHGRTGWHGSSAMGYSALDWHIPRSIGTFRAQSSAIQHMSSATRRAQRIAPEYESEEIRSLVCGDADRRRSRGAKSISNVLASRIASNLITVTS